MWRYVCSGDVVLKSGNSQKIERFWVGVCEREDVVCRCVHRPRTLMSLSMCLHWEHQDCSREL
jgi:hypothetical protein